VINILYEGINKLKNFVFYIIFLVLGIIAGCILAGFFFYKSGSESIRELDNRYSSQYGRATEIIGRLEAELDRERHINRQLQEHNTRARELTFQLTDTAERNVRNLQDAITIIGEIRTKIQILENFYNNSNPGDGNNQR